MGLNLVGNISLPIRVCKVLQDTKLSASRPKAFLAIRPSKVIAKSYAVSSLQPDCAILKSPRMG